MYNSYIQKCWEFFNYFKTVLTSSSLFLYLLSLSFTLLILSISLDSSSQFLLPFPLNLSLHIPLFSFLPSPPHPSTLSSPIHPLFLGCTLVSSQLCNNGIIDAGEECDDGNTADNDGCSMLCAIENNYECNNTMAPSVCTPILLDLDVSDGSLSKDSTAEFFDLNVPVFLFDPTMAQYFISPAGVRRDYLYV